MLYRHIPATGDRLSVLGFGCMRLPQTKDGHIDEARATKQVRRAIDQGVNYLDTAWPYHSGQSEPFLGRALADGYRQRIKLATKLPSWSINSRAEMDDYLNRQLDRLQTDHIDYYLLHNLSGYMWDRLEGMRVIDFLDRARGDGRIVNAGFSFHGKLDDFKHIVDSYHWEFCQIQYNYLDIEYQAGREGLQYAAENDLGVIVMEPLRGGNLGLPKPPPAVAAIWQMADKARTPAEWALRWVWNHPEVTVVLSGMNEDAHIAENLSTADEAAPNSLSENELTCVENVSRAYREVMKVGCTGCGYCMPCPKGVNIPSCFELYNNLHMFNDSEKTRFTYLVRFSGMATGKPGYASQCVQCGECLKKCPQQIQIPDCLAAVVADLEGSDLAEREAQARKKFNMDRSCGD